MIWYLLKGPCIYYTVTWSLGENDEVTVWPQRGHCGSLAGFYTTRPNQGTIANPIKRTTSGGGPGNYIGGLKKGFSSLGSNCWCPMYTCIYIYMYMYL